MFWILGMKNGSLQAYGRLMRDASKKQHLSCDAIEEQKPQLSHQFIRSIAKDHDLDFYECPF